MAWRRALTLVLLPVAACTSRAAWAAEPVRPNLVVLVADDWGLTDVGAFGGEIATPHIDELARRGVRFSNFHVAASCAPTRAMLLTGVEHHRAGVGNLLESMPREHRGRPGYLGTLGPNVVTVASLLQAGGYRTYLSGKWNVGTEPHNLPPQRGFDRSIALGDTGADNYVPTQRYLPHSARVEWFEDGRPARMPAEFYSSAYIVDRALEFLRADAGSAKPFFAYIGFQANHAPLQVPRAYSDAYRGRYDEGWAVWREKRRDRAAALGLLPPGVPMTTMPTTPDWARLDAETRAHQARSMEVYAGMAQAMDEHIGRLVEHLRSSGELDRTVFVFLSDNGPEGSDYKDAQPWLATQYTQALDKLGERGAYAIQGPGWATASAAPFDTFKFYAGEGGLRVPLVIAGAAGAAAGAIHHGLTHVTDIVPTLLELAGVAHPGQRWNGQPVEPIVGRSLLPVLADPARSVRGPADAIGYELSGNQALYKGDLKLVLNLPPIGDGQWHLYDLRRDPGETQDLRERQPAVFEAMKAEHAAWAREHGVLPLPPGYSPVKQVLFNTFHNYWFPQYGPGAIGTLVILVLLWALRRRLRARRRHRSDEPDPR